MLQNDERLRRRFRSKAGRYAAILLAGAGLLHFAIALLGWSLLTLKGWFIGAGWFYVPAHAASAVLLFLGFGVMFWLARRGLRICLLIGSLLLITAASCFCIDIHHRWYQIRAWKIGGTYEYTYLTWWWYNEVRLVR